MAVASARAAWQSLRIMRIPLILLPLSLALAGCGAIQDMFGASGAPAAAAPAEPALSAPTPVQTAALAAPPPSPVARTVDQFDTTTAAQRQAAAAAPAAQGETRLGETVASLGPPAEAGLWMKTGLVTEVTTGRVEYPANGKSVAVELRPSGGAASAGSQLSLAAMRVLEAPLTGLPEVVVYR